MRAQLILLVVLTVGAENGEKAPLDNSDGTAAHSLTLGESSRETSAEDAPDSWNDDWATPAEFEPNELKPFLHLIPRHTGYPLEIKVERDIRPGSIARPRIAETEEPNPRSAWRRIVPAGAFLLILACTVLFGYCFRYRRRH